MLLHTHTHTHTQEGVEERGDGLSREAVRNLYFSSRFPPLVHQIVLNETNYDFSYSTCGWGHAAYRSFISR